MLNIVVSVFFKLLSIIASIILYTIVAILTPVMSYFGFNDFTSSIVSYIQIAFSYANFFIVALHIPKAPLLLVVSICGVIWTFTVTVRAYIMVTSVYKAIKGSGSQRTIGFDTSGK